MQAQATKCLSNQKQWGLAFHMYSDDNRDVVPEEGNTVDGINSPGSATTADNYNYTWYNVVPPTLSLKSLVSLYAQNTPPLPSSGSIFSCPSCPDPIYTAPVNYHNPPDFAQAFFMYAENARLCVNFGTIASGGGVQTRLSGVIKPSATIFMAENDPNSTLSGSVPASSSCVTGYYCVARHMGNTLCEFALCDGSGRAARTNDWYRTQPVADAGYADGVPPTEWTLPTTASFLYWYPSPTTPN